MRVGILGGVARHPRFRLALLAAVAAATFAVAPARGESPDPAGGAEAIVLPAAERYGSAWDVLCRHEEHRQFAELAALCGLHRVLDGDHGLTVFAPINDAFDELGADELERLRSPEARQELRELVCGHLMWDAVREADVTDVLMRATLADFSVAIEAKADDAEHADHHHHHHGPDCDHGAEGGMVEADALFLVAEQSAYALDADTHTGPMYRVEALLLGESRSHEWQHAPDCEANPHHANREARSAQIAQRREAARRDRSGRPNGGSDDSDNARVDGKVMSVRAVDDVAGQGDAGPSNPGPRPGGGTGGSGGAGGGNGGGCGCG